MTDVAINAPAGKFLRPARAPRDCKFARARLRGWNDFAQGKPFRDTYDTWSRKKQFAYERGRQQAAMAMAMARTPATKLTLWKLDEMIEAPLGRACAADMVRRILEETRVARHR